MFSSSLVLSTTMMYIVHSTHLLTSFPSDMVARCKRHLRVWKKNHNIFSIGYRVWRPHANIKLMPDNKSWVPKKFCTQLVQDGWCKEESSAIKFPTATTSSSQNQQWWDEFKTCLHDREPSKFWSVECTDQFFAKIEVVDEGSPDDLGKFAPKLKYLGHWIR